MKLVDNARQCWRWFSMQAMALAIAIQGTWELLPPDLRSSVPDKVVPLVTVALLVSGIFGRLVDQTRGTK